MFWEAIFFYGIAATAVVSALLMVLVKNPVVSAAYLVVTFFSIAACFVMLEAQLLAVLQLIVYAGAIMVLFLFVIMLLNLNRTAFTSYKLFFTKLFSLLLLAVILWVAAGGLGGLATGGVGEVGRAPARVPAEYYAFGSKAVRGEAPEAAEGAREEKGHAQEFAEKLFTIYLYPFEVISVMLLAAIVGAVLIAKRIRQNGDRT
jgi:NADH-quinone oxidoreductase subunit J